MNYSGLNSKAFFVKEDVFNQYAAPASVNLLPFLSEDFKGEWEQSEQSPLLGSREQAKSFQIAFNCSGEFELQAFSDTLAESLYYNLGSKTQSTNISSLLFVYYTGDSASALLSLSEGILSFKTGVLGSEVLDSNFGESGSIDLSDTNYNSISKLTSYLDSLSFFNAFYIGDDTDLSLSIADFSDFNLKTEDGESYPALLKVEDSDTSTYSYEIEAVAADEEHPSFSAGINKGGNFFVYTGLVSESLSLEASAGEIVKLSLKFSGSKELSNQEEPEYTQKSESPFLSAQNIRLFINGQELYDAVSFKLSLDNSLSDKTQNLGSPYSRKASFGALKSELELELFLSESSLNILSSYQADELLNLVIAFCPESGSLKESTFIHIPCFQLSSASYQVKSEEELFLPVKGQVTKSSHSSYKAFNVSSFNLSQSIGE